MNAIRKTRDNTIHIVKTIDRLLARILANLACFAYFLKSFHTSVMPKEIRHSLHLFDRSSDFFCVNVKNMCYDDQRLTNNAMQINLDYTYKYPIIIKHKIKATVNFPKYT